MVFLSSINELLSSFRDMNNASRFIFEMSFLNVWNKWCRLWHDNPKKKNATITKYIPLETSLFIRRIWDVLFINVFIIILYTLLCVNYNKHCEIYVFDLISTRHDTVGSAVAVDTPLEFYISECLPTPYP